MRTIEFLGSPPALNAGSATDAPPTITRLNSWAHADLFLSGPLRRLSGSVRCCRRRWTRSSRFERGRPDASSTAISRRPSSTRQHADRRATRSGSSAGASARATRAASRRVRPAERRRAGHRRARAGRVAASRVGRRRRPARLRAATRSAAAPPISSRPAVIVVERLQRRPDPELLDPGIGTDRTWSVGARVDATGGSATAAAKHRFLARRRFLPARPRRAQSTFSGRVGELINGVRRRASGTSPILRSSPTGARRSLSLFARRPIAIAPRVTINGGLRFERITGSAAPGTSRDQLADLLPRAGVHWTVTDFWQLATFGQYGRYGHRLPLRDLAYGDPTAPTASIYRWNATTAGPPQRECDRPAGAASRVPAAAASPDSRRSIRR